MQGGTRRRGASRGVSTGDDDRGQTATLGVLLMVAVALILVAILAVGVFSLLPGEDRLEGKYATLETEADGSNLTLTHTGGDSLPLNDTEAILRSDGNTRRVQLSSATVVGGNGDRLLEAGESVRIAHSAVDDVELSVVYEPAGAVLLETVVPVLTDLQASASASPSSGTAPLSTQFTASASGGSGGAVKFSDTTPSSYGGGQDADGNVSTFGTAIVLRENTWSSVDYSCEVTPNTTLTFEFRSDDRGEIHGIGLDEDTDASSDRVFRVHGTQNDWGIGTYDGGYTTGSGWQSYSIDVGNHYTGQMNHLVFVNDGDGDEGTSRFRNVRVQDCADGQYRYEWSIDGGPTVDGRNASTVFVANGTYDATVTVTDPTGNAVSRTTTVTVASPPDDPLNFSTEPIQSYGNQDADGAGSATATDGGTTLSLTDNAWKYVDLGTCQVTADTWVVFEFRSSDRGEIHGVGFDDDASEDHTRTFRVYGTQNWGVVSNETYGGSGWRHYAIPVGQHYTGTFDRLVFVQDDDTGGTAASAFRNVRVYERSGGSWSRKCTT